MIHFGALPGSRVENEIMGEKKRQRREKIKKELIFLLAVVVCCFFLLVFEKHLTKCVESFV